MPSFRVAGHVCISFVHEIEAATAEEAEEKVENLRLNALDNYDKNTGENTIYSVVELDEDGNEVEDV